MKKDFNGILGYPRSGNHWLMYCLKECFGNSPYYSHGNNKNFYEVADKGNGTYICIVRNYKECIVRHEDTVSLNKIFSQLQNQLDFVKNDKTDYIAILDWFDKYVDDQKYLIYYEDLILDPKTEMYKIANFVKRTEHNIDDFIEHLDKHKEQSLKNYNDNIQRTITNGEPNKLIYYSKKLSVENKKKIDQHIENNYPELFQKYLIRYKE